MLRARANLSGHLGKQDEQVLNMGLCNAKKLKKAVSGLVLLGLVSGCSTLGGGTPSDIYDLSAVQSFQASGSSSYHIGVALPAAVEALNTNKIAVRPTPLTLQYYGGALWSDALPRLVQARLIQSFENTGRVRGVSGTGGGIASDYVLVVDVRSFEARAFDSSADVEIFVKLVNDRSSRIVESKAFRATVASGKALPAATAALDQAFHQVSEDIVIWTLGKI